MQTRSAGRPLLLFALLFMSILTTIQIPIVHAASFTSPQQVPMGTTLLQDPKLRFVDNAPANGTVLKRDSLVKYVDLNANSHWDPGEALIYDLNNDSFYESFKPVIAGSAAIGSTLRSDPLIKFVDINNNGHWDQGEAVIYDTNNNNFYTFGKPVISGSPVVTGTSLTNDGHVKFIGSGSSWTAGNTVVYASNGGGFYNSSSDPHIRYVDSNSNGHWDQSESVVNDTTLSSTYTSSMPILYGPTPSIGASLKIDPKILFVDSDRNGMWESGEAIVYDADGNFAYDAADTVIVNANPTVGVALGSDSKIKYVQSGTNTTWVKGEVVVYDSVGTGYYNATIDPHIKFWNFTGAATFQSGDPVIYDKFLSGYYQSGDTVIQSYGVNVVGLCSVPQSCPLNADNRFHFVDSSLAGHWICSVISSGTCTSGETVIYDPDSDHVYLTGDIVVFGATPPSGTALTEPVISGKTPAVGTPLKTDPKLKYLEANGNVVWEPGEAVIYDINNDGVYNTTPSPADIVVAGTSPIIGTLLSEPVISGPVPAIGTSLKSDPNLKIIDMIKTGLWVPGETVTYDSNSNGRYDTNEPVIADGAPGNGAWHSGEVVGYDSNNNSIYNTGEPIAYGTAPQNGTSLGNDTRIKYVDNNNNSVWDQGESVAYDTNNNGVYDQGDIIIAGSAPATNLFFSPSLAMDYQGRVWLAWDEKPAGGTQATTVYFKTGNGTVWSNKQAVTPGAFIDTNSFVTPLANQTMMLLWSSNRTTSAQIFYRLFSAGGTGPFSSGPTSQLTSSAKYDHSPTAVQDRNGRIWVAWARTNPQASTSQIFYKYFNGTAWSSDFALPPAIVSGVPYEVSPYITQTKDGKILVVWASNATSGSNQNIFYATTDGTVPTLPSTGVSSASWSSARFGFGDTSDEDDHPSVLQSQDGNYWVFLQRSVLSPASECILYSTASSLAGLTAASQIAGCSGGDSDPSVVQNSDRSVWVFYNSAPTSGFQIFSEKTASQYTGNDLGLRLLVSTPVMSRSDYAINVTAIVQNFGSSIQSGTLTIKANSTLLTSFTVTNMPVGQGQRFYYNWTNVVTNWSNATWGRFIVTATLTNISPANSLNNLDFSASVLERISPPGDVDGNGTVNILDLALVAFCFNTTPVAGTTCNGYVDVNRDGIINISDLAITAFYYNRTV